jgi:hypothetical protein
MSFALSHAAFAADAAPAACRELHSEKYEKLEHVFTRDEFRVFYTLSGPNALADKADRNRNGIPDQVEDIAIQLMAGRDVFSTVIGLTPPLQQPRYANAKAIDVFLVDMGKTNGLAYDEYHNFTRRRDGKGHCALSIDLNRKLSNRNFSPVHELFHLYQYGYSMFKAPWLQEGTSRWAERALQAGEPPTAALPADQAQIEQQLLGVRYEASLVWNRLAVLLDPVGRLRLPPELQAMTYVDGTAVVQDDMLHGAAFMKDWLEALGKASQAVSREKSWDPYRWQEADQKSPARNDAILGALLTVVKRQSQQAGIESAELEAFLRALQPKN